MTFYSAIHTLDMCLPLPIRSLCCSKNTCILEICNTSVKYLYARSTLKESVHRRLGPLLRMVHVQHRQKFSQHTGKVEHFFFFVLLHYLTTKVMITNKSTNLCRISSKHRRNLISEILLFYKRKL